MRGGNTRTGELLSYVDLQAWIRRDHPLRAIREIVNEALVALEGEFAALYLPIGRPSIPPEKLLRAMLLHAFYSISSERLLMERLEFGLLFRWFVGLAWTDRWGHSAADFIDKLRRLADALEAGERFKIRIASERYPRWRVPDFHGASEKCGWGRG